MTSTLSPSGIKVKIFPYEDFQGIDASRDKFALDTGQQQHLLTIENGFADHRGVIVRDGGASKWVEGNNALIQHINFFGRELAAWAQKDGGGISLVSSRDHKAEEVYPRNAIVSSTVFGRRLLFCSRGQLIYQYDGLKWEQNKSQTKPKPAYMTAIQRRLATAGYQGFGTEIHFSRVDDPSIFPDDEEPNSTNVLKASKLDIGNVIGTADEIRGLGVFDNSRLAVFTHDRTLVYMIDPDYTRWAIDPNANIRVGTISHNTICQAGADLLFCSRDGVHSIRRSDNNGVTIYSVPLSHKVDLLYRKLLRQVDDPELISAVYDQDNGQYHIFFPHPGDILATRLTLTINPIAGGEHKWSTGTFLNARCGAFLGGILLYGTSGGVYRIYDHEEIDGVDVVPKMTVVTPVLWQGALNDKKESVSFILQASGQTEMLVEAFDERGRAMSSYVINVDDTAADDNFPDVPLSRQYERKFEHNYRGLQFRITAQGTGTVRIIGFAVTVRRQ